MSKKVLITWGGWDGHEPKQCCEIVAESLKKHDCEIIMRQDLDCYLDEELMKSLDLIVPCWTMSGISEEQSQGLRDTVKNGCGLAGWHGGLCDSFRHDTEYQYMCGGNWVVHPGNIIDYEVNILNTGDPVTEGIKDFKMNSEQYYLHVDPGVKVLATTTFSGEHDPWIDGVVMPVVWKKAYGKGKVFYSSLGHVAKDLKVPEALEMFTRGALWAALRASTPR